MPTIEDAIALALDAHKGTKQKDGSPYILHPLTLMVSLHTEYEQMAAVLHDVVEDTSITLEAIEAAGYPDAVIQALDALTHRETDSYDDYIERIKLNPIARRVKLADLEHNMDVRRLTVVTDYDQQRLEKYRRVWHALRAIEDADLK